MKRIRRILLLIVMGIIVVSFNIQTVDATTMGPPYNDGNYAIYYANAYYDLNYGAVYARAGAYSSGTQKAWVWIGEHFTASATDTFRLSTSTRLTAYLEAFKVSGKYADARVTIKMHCWYLWWGIYFPVKSLQIFTRSISFRDDTFATYTNEVITGFMDCDLLNGATYCFAVEMNINAYDNGDVKKTSVGFNYATLKVDWLKYVVAP